MSKKGTITYYNGNELITEEYTVNPTQEEIQENYARALNAEIENGAVYRFVLLDMRKVTKVKLNRDV